MGFRLKIWPQCLFAAGVTLAAVCPADAQPANRRAGEPIIFSSPDGDAVSSNIPTLGARPPALLDLSPSVQPSINFSPAPPARPLPPPPPMISPAETLRMQQQLDERRNWALMTPEQILGVATPEKILGVQDLDIFGQPKRATVLEQFCQRQDLARVRTNHSPSTARWELPDNQDSPWDFKLLNPAAGNAKNSAFLGQFLMGTNNNHPAISKPDSSSDWFKTFSPPAAIKATADQQIAAKQFQQLLQSQFSSDNPAKASAFEGPLYSTHPAAHASGSSPFGTPLGGSFTPMNSAISLPVAAASLPGFLAPTNRTLLLSEPDWKRQSAPWQSPGPQLGVAPQRKF